MNNPVRVTQHAPAARGVTQLMYVGDDQAVESAIAAPGTLVALAVIGVIGWLVFGGRRP